MTLAERAKNEIRELGLIALCFAGWFLALMTLKRLVLAEYQIQAGGLAFALIGALVVAKVVAILEHVSLGVWLRRLPAVVDVAVGTLLYTGGVALVLWLEKAFDLRHEAGGFGAAFASAFAHRDANHVWAAAIGVGLGLLGFDAFSLVRKHLGEGGLRRLFATPLERLEVNAPWRAATSREQTK
jgi:hypothetical protein